MKLNRIFLLFFLLASLLIVIHLQLRNYAYDDAYIHFRIARNFVQHGQPYFNLGQPVMASSSSGWTIVLSILFALFGANPLVVSIANAIFLTAGSYFFYQLTNQIQPKRPLENVLYAILYVGFLIVPSVGLMETSFCLMLLALSVLLYFRKNAWSLLIFGMLPFFRLELFFFTFLILLFTLLNAQFSIKKIILLPLLSAAPFLLYELAFFGTIIPNTIYAKQASYNIPVLTNFANIIHSFFPLPQHGIWLVILTCYVFILLVPFCALLLFRQSKYLYPFEWALFLSGLCVIGFYLYGKTIIFSWYMPLYILPILMPIYRLILDRAPILKRVFTVIVALPAIFLFIQISSAAFLINPFLNHETGYNARVNKYLEVGQDLYKKYPDSCLMTSEIGGLGWAFQGCILDGVGLVSPEAIKYHNEQYEDNGKLPILYIKQKKPEIIVNIRWFMVDFKTDDLTSDYFLQEEPIFIEHDLALIEGPSPNDGMDVFVRKDLFEESYRQ